GAAVAASRFAMPVMVAPPASADSSAALVRARSASREPMITWWPPRAHRCASPAPSLPVPPSIPMCMNRLDVDERVEGRSPGGRGAAWWTSGSRPLPEEIAGRVAQEGATAALSARPVEPADDDHGDAVELAHDGLGRRRQLVGDGKDGCLQHVACGILLSEIALERLRPSPPPGHLCPVPR